MARVLLINDEEDLLFLYRVALERAGHSVEATADDEHALELVARFHPDVIGLDWVLPGSASGEHVLRRLRAAPETRAIPILVISALHGLADRAVRLGADGFLQKPFRVADLVGALQRLIDRSRPQEPELDQRGS